MSEIKTCEQYVVSRIQDLENENEDLKSQLHERTALLKEAVKRFKAVREAIELGGSDGEGWKFNLCVYQKYDKTNFKILAETLGYEFDEDGNFKVDLSEKAEKFTNDIVDVICKVVADVKADLDKEKGESGDEQ